ncbi:hypothetical protein JIQ42_03990 [Leishmania sp. Namibia]|uniref:hypothetical protein n=1 Tax=Leishmania sp. Namibia TaxID=2802991 RepID=UPI001B60D2AB|nr:hypothetical protein JIQ42_03990 [Leishmania sp. Namibia]
MHQRARATERAAPAHDVQKALSTSLSESSDESALPMHFVAGGASRRVGRVSDDEYEVSSYEETETSDDSFSDRSEDYVPLAFEFINSNPRRRAGAPAHSEIPCGVLEEVDERESLSFSDAPLEVFLERRRTRRHCGPGAKDSNWVVVTSSRTSNTEDADGSSSTISAALSIAFERRKRTHMVGKVEPPAYELSCVELSVSLSDEEETPLNAQLIHTLIKRLRNPSDEVSLEAFEFLDFSDENFKEELEPLKQIKALLEQKASNPMVANAKRDLEVKEAILSLPPEKAVAAKVKAIKSRQIRPSLSKGRLYSDGKTEVQKAQVIADLVRCLKDPCTEMSLRVFEGVDWSNRNLHTVLALLQPIRAYMEAKEVAKGKPAEGEMSDASLLDRKIKTAIMCLPSQEAVAAMMDTAKTRDLSNSSSNGDAIRHLVGRLKRSGQSVTQCEFDKIDWNDRNFIRELEPLRQICACMEAMEALQETPGENVMADRSALNEQIKTAIISLPPEKAIAVKAQMLKMRERAHATAQGSQAVKVAKLSAPAGKIKKLQESAIMPAPSKKLKAKKGKLSATNSQVMQADVMVILSQQPTYKVKESTALSTPAKKTRRPRGGGCRNVSISMAEDDIPLGEIVEGDQEFLESGEPLPSEAGTAPRHLLHVPSRPAGTKKPERRPRNCRWDNHILHESIPMEEHDIIQEEDKVVRSKRKASRRRANHYPGRSLSITSLPNLEAGEVLEEPTLPVGRSSKLSHTRGVTPAHLGFATKAKPRRSRPDPPGNSTQFYQLPKEVTDDMNDNTALQVKAHFVPQKKKRRGRVNNNSRSCSFLAVDLDEVHEIQDGGASELKGLEVLHETSLPKRSKKLVRRRGPGGEGNGRALNYNESEMGKASELGGTQHSNAKPGKRRRVKVHRTRSANTSMLVELESGEIFERPDETLILYTSSCASTPAPEESIARRVNGRAIVAKAHMLSHGACDVSSTSRKRRHRLHMSKELSISAVPENLAGEIVENAPDSLAATVPVSSSFPKGCLSKVLAGQARRLPLLNGTEQGSLSYAVPPASSLRPFTKSRGGTLTPKVGALLISETIYNAPLPPSSSIRRSAEVGPCVAKAVATAPDDVQRIPSVRASM